MKYWREEVVNKTWNFCLSDPGFSALGEPFQKYFISTVTPKPLSLEH